MFEYQRVSNSRLRSPHCVFWVGFPVNRTNHPSQFHIGSDVQQISWKKTPATASNLETAGGQSDYADVSTSYVGRQLRLYMGFSWSSKLGYPCNYGDLLANKKPRSAQTKHEKTRETSQLTFLTLDTLW
jgi:hypothetical protein